MKYIGLVCDNCGKVYDSNQCGKYHHFCCIECRREAGKIVVTEASRKASRDNIIKANKTLLNQEQYVSKRREILTNGAKPSTYMKYYGRHEHRVVAEKKLGRPLKKGEIVHHIDGNKHNNSPDNLMVMTQSEHIKLHLNQGDMVRKKVMPNGAEVV